MAAPVLTTNRLILRPWSEGDLDAIHTLLADPDVRRYLCDDLILPKETVAGFVARSMAASQSHSIGCWHIHAASDPAELIGFCGLSFIDETAEVELKYALLPAYWGRGLATEASRALIAHAWKATELSCIYARTDSPNIRSVEVMRRLGMTLHSSEGLIAYKLTRS